MRQLGCGFRMEERFILAEIGKRLGRNGLAKVAGVAKPDTILGWFRRLVAQKFDGSKRRSCPGRPRIDTEVETLIVQMARENSGWGYEPVRSTDIVTAQRQGVR
jgi:putative transposase